MQLEFEGGEIRSWRVDDETSLAFQANNRKIWENLRDAAPLPYTIDNAREFIELAHAKSPETYFCIDIAGKAVGSIGYILNDNIHRFTAEIGYWLGEEFWGRGITTAVMRKITTYAIKTHNLHRIYAVPFESNQASCRVLEKAGYQFEGRMIKSGYKDGKLVNQMHYAHVVDTWRP